MDYDPRRDVAGAVSGHAHTAEVMTKLGAAADCFFLAPDTAASSHISVIP